MKKLFKKTLSILPVIALLFVTASTLLFAVACGKNEKTSENKNQLSPEDIAAAQLFHFVSKGTGYAVNRYKGTNPVVTIPGTYRGKPVVEISNGVFNSNKTITKVAIPASVQTIGDWAFSYCDLLEEVIFKANSNLKTIGDSAFSYCTSLTSITIPASVTIIEIRAFSDCTSLEEVIFEEESSLEKVSSSLFSGCLELTGITIPASVTTIGDSAFSYCTSLTSITIPASVTTIYNAFSGCTSLTTLEVHEDNQNYKSETNCILTKDGKVLIRGAKNSVIPDDVEMITRDAFSGAGITSITIPASVTGLGQYAFSGCTSLEEVIFEEESQLETIEWGAFYGCTSLTSITIPASVTTIGEYTFKDCASLITIEVHEDNQNYKSEENCILTKDGKTLIRGTENSVIPDGVESISGYAFSGTKIISITIPASVQTIGDWAFSYCTSLATVTFEEDSQLATIGIYAFYETAITSITIYGNGTNINKICRQLSEIMNFTGITLQIDPILVGVIDLSHWNFFNIMGYPE